MNIIIPDKVELVDNTEKKQFEWKIGEHLARIEYMIKPNGDIGLLHTEVDEPLEGKGVAAKLVKAVLELIESKKVHVIPYCSYVLAYLKKHKQQ